MIRKLITVVLPFLVPFVAYWIYWWAAKRRQIAAAQGKPPSVLESFPWTWLVTAGTGLAIVTLSLTVILGGNDPSSQYHSPRLEDGKVVPGRFGS